jgi:hypothetical protein
LFVGEDLPDIKNVNEMKKFLDTSHGSKLYNRMRIGHVEWVESFIECGFKPSTYNLILTFCCSEVKVESMFFKCAHAGLSTTDSIRFPTFTLVACHFSNFEIYGLLYIFFNLGIQGKWRTILAGEVSDPSKYLDFLIWSICPTEYACVGTKHNQQDKHGLSHTKARASTPFFCNHKTFME